MITLLGSFVEDIAKIAKTGAQRHHMALAQAVNWRVRHLREILPEKMMQTAIPVRQYSKRRVIPH